MAEPQLLELVRKHRGGPEAFDVTYDGEFGTGVERFVGWPLAHGLITRRDDEAIPEGQAVVVALFLTEDGRVVTTYDRNAAPTGGVDDLRPHRLLGGTVKWVSVDPDLAHSLVILHEREAENAAVQQAHVAAVQLEGELRAHG